MSSGNSGDRKQLGNLGEDLAADHLIGKGYRILYRNFRCRLGEIDLIAQNDEFLVFVEVKTRKGEQVDPLISITRRKQKKLLDLARYFLAYKLKEEMKQPRFDVISVRLEAAESRIEHIENAFTFA